MSTLYYEYRFVRDFFLIRMEEKVDRATGGDIWGDENSRIKHFFNFIVGKNNRW